jgi:TPR repeat protein
MPAPVTGQPVKKHEAGKKSIAKLESPALRSSDRVKSPPPREDSTTSRATKKPASNPNPDARLAEQGDAFAQYRLGRFYAQHAGPQAPESVTWYVKASDGLRRLAEEGDGEAMYVLGVMYAFGRGVAKDREQARLWLEQAVDQRVPAAHMVLARLDGHRSADSR